MKAVAPGKVILSGEHSVVYGKPSVVMAVDRSAEAVITPDATDMVSFDLKDFAQTGSFTLRALRDFKSRIVKNYNMFLNGELGIREVLYKPVELFQYAFITVLDGLHLTLGTGVNIQLRSNIPIGCGMGSSAATILSVLRAVGHYFRVDFRPDWYYAYSLEAENLQHGHSSGVDPYISLHGGCARFQAGHAEKLPLPRTPMFLVQTGVPSCTTGECVAEVRRSFASSRVWDDFEKVTVAIQDALVRNDAIELRRLVRENHRLLVEIGVVPGKVREFVANLEQQGLAAKICGAGAVSGDNGGIVLVLGEKPPVDICTKYGYELVAVRGEPLGVRIIG